jgi:guanylate kinase
MTLRLFTSRQGNEENEELDLLLEGTDTSSYEAIDKTLSTSIGEVEAPDETPTTRWFRYNIVNDDCPL